MSPLNKESNQFFEIEYFQKTRREARYRFNAKELDPETGNYYYGARYYDPKVSVWLSVDALAGQFPHVSPYNFCLNNPINLMDPDGNAPGDPPRGGRPSTAGVSDRTNIQSFTGLSQQMLKSNGDFSSVPKSVNPYSLGGNSNVGISAGVKVKLGSNLSLGVTDKGEPTVGVGPLNVTVGEENVETNIDLSPFFQYKKSSREITQDVKFDPDGDGNGPTIPMTNKEEYQKIKIIGFTREERELNNEGGLPVRPPQSREGVEIGVSKGAAGATLNLKQSWKDGN